MQTDSQAINEGVRALSYAHTQVHSICDKIKTAVDDAKRTNSNPKFKKTATKIEEIISKMRFTTKDMIELARKLEQLQSIVAQFEN